MHYHGRQEWLLASWVRLEPCGPGFANPELPVHALRRGRCHCQASEEPRGLDATQGATICWKLDGLGHLVYLNALGCAWAYTEALKKAPKLERMPWFKIC